LFRMRWDDRTINNGTPIYLFLQQYLIDEQQDFELHRLLLTCQHSSAYVHSLAHSIVVTSIDSFTPTELPVQPQRFNLTEEHDLPPQMPDARPYFADRGRRRALIVRGRRTDTTRSFLPAFKIGINYIFHSDTRFRLRYCVEDAYAVANFLRGTIILHAALYFLLYSFQTIWALHAKTSAS